MKFADLLFQLLKVGFVAWERGAGHHDFEITSRDACRCGDQEILSFSPELDAPGHAKDAS